MKCGLLMICPEAFNVGEVTYVDYEGREETPSEVVTRALGPVSKVLILKLVFYLFLPPFYTIYSFLLSILLSIYFYPLH